MPATRLNDLEFAVLDFETTGLFPHRADRVIEVGVTRLSGRGEIVREFSTLVQPQRDMGPTRIHGLRARDVEAAPTFDAIAGALLESLEGAVLVGHNVDFDLRFLFAECERLRVELPEPPRLCTLQLGLQLGQPPPPRRNLMDACAYFGIELELAHCALDDARAAADLLAVYLQIAAEQGLSTLGELGCLTGLVPRSKWPRLPVLAEPVPRSAALRRPRVSVDYLQRVMKRMPATRSGDEVSLVPYLELLERALEDRRLTLEEVDDLHSLASAMGLSTADMERAHRSFLEGLAAAANADGVVTEAEARDLNDAAALLGFGDREIAEALANSRSQSLPSMPRAGPSLSGKSVCFTGEITCTRSGQRVTREDASRLATAAGLEVRAGVTKKLDLLVVADADTLSNKAKKAREYGTRILTDVVFFTEIGVSLD